MSTVENLASSDERLQLEALNELATMLCIAMEEYVYSFDVHSHVPALVNLLPYKSTNYGDDVAAKPEIILLTCRCLALILEMIPHSCAVVCSSGAVERLLIQLNSESAGEEVREEILKAVAKISVDSPQTLISDTNVIKTILSSVEVLPQSLQRTALSIIANVCRKITKEELSALEDVLPRLSDIIGRESNEIVEQACTCFVHLINRFRDSEETIRLIVFSDKHNLLTQVLDRLRFVVSSKNDARNSNNIPAISATIGLMMNLLAELCLSSSELTLQLYSEKTFLPIVRSLLTPSSVDLSLLMVNQDNLLASLYSNDKSLQHILYMLNSVLLPSISSDAVYGDIYSLPLHEWMWEDDFHNFTSYESHVSAQIEMAYAAKQSNVTVRVKAGGTYRIQFNELKQYNVLSRQVRNVMRHPIPCGYTRKEVQNWNHADANSNANNDSLLFGSDLMEIDSNNTTREQVSPSSTKKRSKVKQWITVSEFSTAASAVHVQRSQTTNNAIDQHSEVLASFFVELLPLVLSLCCSLSSAHSSSESTPAMIREECISIAAKIIHHYHAIKTSSKEGQGLVQLPSLDENTCHLISNFVIQALHAAINSSSSLNQTSRAITLSNILHLVDIAMEGMGETFRSAFMREGIMDLLKRVSESNNLPQLVCQQAVAVLKRHFESIDSATYQHCSLHEFCDKLSQAIVDDDTIFSELCDLFKERSNNTVSVHQILSSDFASKLLNFLLTESSGSRVNALARALSANPSSFSSLVRLLNTALSHAEAKFSGVSDIHERQATRTPPANGGNQLSATASLMSGLFSSPFKATLSVSDDRRDQDNDHVMTPQITVQVEPLVTIQKLEGFLRSSEYQRLQAAATTRSKKKAEKAEKGATSEDKKSAENENKSEGEDEEESQGDDDCDDEEEVFYLGVDTNIGNTDASLPQYEVLLEGHILPVSFTIIQAASKFSLKQCEFGSMWHKPLSITYRQRLPATAPTTPSTFSSSFYDQFIGDTTAAHNSNASITKDPMTDKVILCLKLLSGINDHWRFLVQQNHTFGDYNTIIPSEQFISRPLLSKLLSQLQNPISLPLSCAGALPEWVDEVLTSYSFLIPFSVRRLYFFFSAFVAPGSVIGKKVYDTGSNNSTNSSSPSRRVSGRITKATVSRTSIIDSAMKALDSHLSGKNSKFNNLEIEFENEVGTGLGPTLEFFTIVSHELQNPELGLFITTPYGLFPAPIAGDMNNNNKSSNPAVQHFRFFGKFIAVALRDGRLLDIPLATLFYSKLKVFLQGNYSTAAPATVGSYSLDELKLVDVDIANSLASLQRLHQQYQQQLAASNNNSNSDNHSALEKLKSTVQDMCIDFSFRGVELKPGAPQVMIEDLDEYIRLVCKYMLHDGLQPVLTAIKEGLNEVFDASKLNVFTANELHVVLCGKSDEDQQQHPAWTEQELLDNFVCDHGYHRNSVQLQYLVDILCNDFTPAQRRQFLLFTTGTTRLPLGGFRNLAPKFTIVKSIPANAAVQVDSMLPTCNTCFHYLKLPQYSSRAIMKEKLLYAISEGQGSFDLS